MEAGLAEALEPFNVRLGYLDRETIARAVPVWPGTGPWHQAAAAVQLPRGAPMLNLSPRSRGAPSILI